MERGDFLAQSPGQWGVGGKKMLRVGLGKRKPPHRQEAQGAGKDGSNQRAPGLVR